MKRFVLLLWSAVIILAGLSSVPVHVSAAGSDFSLQVSPSPLVETVKPGASSEADLQIRNTGTKSEELKMALRSFTMEQATGKVTIGNDAPKDVSSWVTFSDPDFTVAPGALFVQHVQFDVPSDAGFSYSFAITVSRAHPATGSAGKAAIEGSVAIFTLVSVDRPNATSKIDLLSFSSKKKVYEFLPSEFSLELKNNGNTIIQPTGNIFIQHTAHSQPLATLPVNAKNAYFLPNISRTITSEWTDGFPVYKTDTNGKKHLVWDWGTLQKLRIGHYVAKAVVIYNDGSRDVPIQTTVGFWVIPWRLLFGLLVVAVLIITGLVTLLRKTGKVAHRKHEKISQ